MDAVNGKYPCIVALEEVTESTFSEIKAANIFDSCLFSLDFRRPGKYEGGNRRLGCLIGTVGYIEVSQVSIVNRIPFPERSLTTTIRQDSID